MSSLSLSSQSGLWLTCIMYSDVAEVVMFMFHSEWMHDIAELLMLGNRFVFSQSVIIHCIVVPL